MDQGLVKTTMASTYTIEVIDRLHLLMDRHSNNIDNVRAEIHNMEDCDLLDLLEDLCEFTERILDVTNKVE